MKNLILAIAFLPLLSCGKTKDNAAEAPTATETYTAADTTTASTTSSTIDTASANTTVVDGTATTTINEKAAAITEKTTPEAVVAAVAKTKTMVAESKMEAAAINHANWNSLLQKNVSKNGTVNYKGFQKDSKALSAYLSELAAAVPTKSWSRIATLAYWINAYNAYTVKLIIDNYPTKSIKDINDPWGKKFITLEGKKYSLEGIENEILRKMDEPRIHFAINCASVSCPNLLNEAYTESKLEQQLKTATKSFINDKSKNTITASKIEVSKIFDWFAGDFKSKGGVIDFLNQSSSTKISGNAQVTFKEYNWNLNE
ncbi:DUF547 domain-containing protein [Flavobacterium sp.]|uniref:DUF547 domain-containing protein n=1 Tax=Flavobacterium sp. TaxID=239 RepID=UPI002627FC72|nr:DUF547 domain-containing protein [Flavobacterium sp.]MDG2433770.1 DUF547 domain-containing protein [Flavobacterium sp.]